MLPVLFIVLASAALLAALAALFASLRASLAGPADVLWTGAEPDRGALEDEKNALLRALKDLEYEHEVGKIDDEDYARLERAYRARAKEVLGELDRDLRPYLSRAEALAGGLSDPTSDPKKAKKKKKKDDAKSDDDAKPQPVEVKDVASEAEPEGEPAPTAHRTCPKCSTANDADAAFCKKCATPLIVAEPAT